MRIVLFGVLLAVGCAAEGLPVSEEAQEPHVEDLAVCRWVFASPVILSGQTPIVDHTAPLPARGCAAWSHPNGVGATLDLRHESFRLAWVNREGSSTVKDGDLVFEGDLEPCRTSPTQFPSWSGTVAIEKSNAQWTIKFSTTCDHNRAYRLDATVTTPPLS